MSGFKFTLNLDRAFKSPDRDEDKRFRDLAKVVSRKLDTIQRELERQELVFDAGATEMLAMRFDDFAEGTGGCHEFAKWWDELCDWGETLVTFGERERSLCEVPELPLAFSC